MKKNIFIALALLTTFLTGCDIIDFPVIEYGTYRDDIYGPAPSFTSLGSPTQRVLLEDFTGHDCGNCPEAHLAAKEILENHEEDVALVAVHAGSLAEPFGQFPDDWRTAEGEYYLLTQIGTDLLPTGRVNRRGGASQDESFGNWTSVTDSELSETPAVDMQLDASYVAENQHLNVHVNSQWFNAATGNFKLVILITQDSIIAPQLNYDADPEFIPD
ncbi:MAG: Omp28-related outer membrane protein, partial [Flavobacteriales bacterium]